MVDTAPRSGGLVQGQRDDILALQPDGIFLSNGPGDPAAVADGVRTIQALLGKKPLFGICLGHQLLALSLGASTFKMKFGHRGLNQPVKDLTTGRIEVTTQNHGFCVDVASAKGAIVETHKHLNDGTNEGIAHPETGAFSVQYHPEASARSARRQVPVSTASSKHRPRALSASGHARPLAATRLEVFRAPRPM